MSPRAPLVSVEAVSFPRVSGDEPSAFTGNFRDAMFSPRERG